MIKRPVGETPLTGLIMNVPPMVFRDAEFLLLREKIGPCALHALTALGTTLQSRKATRLKIQSPKALAMTCDLLGDIDPDLLWSALVGVWLINPNQDGYEFPFFVDNNSQLLSLWANGEKRRKAGSNLIELNQTQSNRIESK
jgi:hypothetical protein